MQSTLARMYLWHTRALAELLHFRCVQVYASFKYALLVTSYMHDMDGRIRSIGYS